MNRTESEKNIYDEIIDTEPSIKICLLNTDNSTNKKTHTRTKTAIPKVQSLTNFQNNTKNLDQIIDMKDFDVFFALNQQKIIARDPKVRTLQNSTHDLKLIKNSSMSNFKNSSMIDYQRHFKN